MLKFVHNIGILGFNYSIFINSFLANFSDIFHHSSIIFVRLNYAGKENLFYCT